MREGVIRSTRYVGQDQLSQTSPVAVDPSDLLVQPKVRGARETAMASAVAAG